MKKPRQYALQGVCNRIAGSARDGAILYRGNYWTPKASIDVFDDGRIWIAKRAEKWCDETGLTIDQHRRAITNLRRDGLIETTQAWFGRQYITHLRLTDKALDLICAGVLDNGSAKRSSEVGNRGTPIATSSAAKRSEIAQPMGRSECASELRRSAHLYEKREHNEIRNKDEESGSRCDTAIEPDGSRQGLRGRESSIEDTWKSEVGARYDRHVSLTVAHRKQLKQFAERCPHGSAREVLIEAVASWSTFTFRAKTEAGAFNVPEVPQVEFLLRFTDVAVSMLQRRQEQSQQRLDQGVRHQRTQAEREAMREREILAQRERALAEERLQSLIDTIELSDEEEDERRRGEWEEATDAYVAAPLSVIELSDVPWSDLPTEIRNTDAEIAHRRLFIRYVVGPRRGIIAPAL